VSRRPARWRAARAAALFIAGAALLLGVRCLGSAGQRATRDGVSATARQPATPVPTATEPILPPPPTVALSSTRAPAAGVPSLAPPWAQPTEPPTATPIPSPESARRSPEGTAAQTGLYTLRQRLGVCASGLRVTPDVADRLGFGWYLDWDVHPDAFRSVGVEYMPMIRLREGEP